MTYLAASDLHGNAEALLQIIQRFKTDKADALLLAGDIGGSRSEQFLQIFEQIKTHTTAVQGNCDTSYDQELLQLPLPLYHILSMGVSYKSKKLTLTHGHHITPESLAFLENSDIFIYGHTHIPVLEKHTESNCIILNPGSAAAPRGGYPATYALITPEAIMVKKLLQGEIVWRLPW